MGVMNRISDMESQYGDKENRSTQVREKLIKTIVELDKTLNLNNYTNLSLRQYDNEQLVAIATNLKVKLKSSLTLDDEPSLEDESHKL